MVETSHQLAVLAGRERQDENYCALRDERNRGLDRVTRQRLRIQQLSTMLQVFVDAAEEVPPRLLCADELARARAVLNQEDS